MRVPQWACAACLGLAAVNILVFALRSLVLRYGVDLNEVARLCLTPLFLWLGTTSERVVLTEAFLVRPRSGRRRVARDDIRAAGIAYVDLRRRFRVVLALGDGRRLTVGAYPADPSAVADAITLWVAEGLPATIALTRDVRG